MPISMSLQEKSLTYFSHVLQNIGNLYYTQSVLGAVDAFPEELKHKWISEENTEKLYFLREMLRRKNDLPSYLLE